MGKGEQAMKVLYISHHKEASGWGQAARDYILAMDKVGIDVVPRAIKLGNSTNNLPDRILELEKKSVENCNICIQHVLPHYMKYDSCFDKNIGFCILETSGIKHTSWPKYLNLMDEIWTPCSDIGKECYQSNITKPVKVVPHTININDYTKVYPKLNLPNKDKFTFYFIGEFIKRKHLSALVQAFHTEFKPHEPVELVIKVNKFGMNSETLAEELKNFCNKIKDNLRLYKDPNRYKAEILITVNIARSDLLSLHSSCDCFVSPSYGEAFCIPALEAMAMGNLVISSAVGGPKDYIDAERNGFLVGGTMEPVFGQHETFEEFGTAREKWFNISVSDLCKTMRRVYQMDKSKKANIKTEAHMSAFRYSYENIGDLMKELLSV